MNESEEDIWEDKDWKNHTCAVSLWTIELGGKHKVGVVAGGGRITDLDERKDGTGTPACSGKDGKVDSDKDGYGDASGKEVINGVDGLLVGKDDSTKFIDAGSNGSNDLVLVFASLLWWSFPLKTDSQV